MCVTMGSPIFLHVIVLQTIVLLSVSIFLCFVSIILLTLMFVVFSPINCWFYSTVGL